MEQGDNRIWSGSPLGVEGDWSRPSWFDGQGFFLNKVEGEEVGESDDPRLSPDERQSLLDAADAMIEAGELQSHPVLEIDAFDPRSKIGPSASCGSLGLGDLNHDPLSLRSILLTTFDLVDDVAWLQQELRLDRNVPITLCAHPWPGQRYQRERMQHDFRALFEDAVVHFPGVPAGMDVDSVSDSACTAHSKLILLEFTDRLRICVTSANLLRKHWSFRSEVLWVQDFRRNTSDHGVRHLLYGGQFSKTLAHFLANLLADAPRRRQCAWLKLLSSFNLSDAAAKLVVSLPGYFLPALCTRVDELSLRLGAVSCHDFSQDTSPSSDQIGGVMLQKRDWPRRKWQLHCTQTGRKIGVLDEVATRALDVAHLLGLRIRSEALVLPSCPETVERSNTFGSESSSLLFQRLREFLWRSLGMFNRKTLAVRVVLEGDCQPTWIDGIPLVLAQLETNYGLLAMKEHLAHETWLPTEERHYVAISGSIAWPTETWLRDMDLATGCVSTQGTVGPYLLLPPGDGPIDSCYGAYNRCRRLGEHSPPWHAPGRELVPNHAKLITRIFWNAKEAMPYGWIYVGSHNLTKAAWGEFEHRTWGDEDIDFSPRLWISNREVGVLLLEPRQSLTDGLGVGPENKSLYKCLFKMAPLPFGLPVVEADISDRELIKWEWPEAQEEDSGSYWNWWEYDEDSTSEEQACVKDWRFRRSSWWYWV